MANPTAAPAADAPHLEGLPREYTNVREELDALLHGVGLVDRSPMGRLRFDGADAQDLLNRLSTNDLEDMAPGNAVYTVLTSNKGRIIDLLLVLKHDDRLTVIANPGRVEAVTDHVDFFNFGEDVEISDQSEEAAMLGLSGPGAPSLIASAIGPDAWHEQPGSFAGVDIGEIRRAAHPQRLPPPSGRRPHRERSRVRCAPATPARRGRCRHWRGGPGDRPHTPRRAGIRLRAVPRTATPTRPSSPIT